MEPLFPVTLFFPFALACSNWEAPGCVETEWEVQQWTGEAWLAVSTIDSVERHLIPEHYGEVFGTDPVQIALLPAYEIPGTPKLSTYLPAGDYLFRTVGKPTGAIGGPVWIHLPAVPQAPYLIE